MQGVLFLGPKKSATGLCGSSRDDSKSPPTVKGKDIKNITNKMSSSSASSPLKDEKEEVKSSPPSFDSKSSSHLAAPSSSPSRPSAIPRGSIHVGRSSISGSLVDLTPQQQENRIKESNKIKYWSCRLHRLILHRYVASSSNKNNKLKYVNANDDYPIAIDQLLTVHSTPNVNPNSPSKIYLEFSDGSEFKCKIDSIEEFNVWFDLLQIFTDYHHQLPHTGKKYTYKTYPIPSLYKTALIDCFNYIKENGVHEEGIFRAGKTDVQQLRQVIISGGLDTSKPQDVLGVAFVCKSILRSLPETLLTNYLLPHFMDAATNKNMRELITCIQDLPEDNREILHLLLETCILCCLSDTSKMTVESMAKVVGPNFLDTEDPTLLMKIKTGELPLISLFDMMMYNMKEVFGPESLQMPKKKKKEELGLSNSPRMARGNSSPQESENNENGNIVYVEERGLGEKKEQMEKEKKEQEEEKEREKERVKETERQRLENELKEKEKDLEQRENAQKEKEKKDLEQKTKDEEEEREKQKALKLQREQEAEKQKDEEREKEKEKERERERQRLETEQKDKEEKEKEAAKEKEKQLELERENERKSKEIAEKERQREKEQSEAKAKEEEKEKEKEKEKKIQQENEEKEQREKAEIVNAPSSSSSSSASFPSPADSSSSSSSSSSETVIPSPSPSHPSVDIPISSLHPSTPPVENHIAPSETVEASVTPSFHSEAVAAVSPTHHNVNIHHDDSSDAPSDAAASSSTASSSSSTTSPSPSVPLSLSTDDDSLSAEVDDVPLNSPVGFTLHVGEETQ